MATTAYVVKVTVFDAKRDVFLVLNPLNLTAVKADATQFTDKNLATTTAAELLASNLGTMKSTEVVEL